MRVRQRLWAGAVVCSSRCCRSPTARRSRSPEPVVEAVRVVVVPEPVVERVEVPTPTRARTPLSAGDAAAADATADHDAAAPLLDDGGPAGRRGRIDAGLLLLGVLFSS